VWQSRGLRAAPTRIAAIAGAFALVVVALVTQASGSSNRSASSSVHLARTDSAAAAVGGRSGVTGGALFGGNYPVVPLEKSLGRKLAIVRLYYFVGSKFPGPAAYGKLLAQGRTALISMDGGGSYASIAAGRRDADILSFLQAVNRAAVNDHLGSIYVTYIHEPDSVHHRKAGAPVQYLQAWDHVHQLAAAHHLDWNDGGRLHWVLILIHNTYGSWRVGEFWPGNSEVDLIAADGYNSSGCGHNGQNRQQTPSDTFGPVVRFAASHGNLPILLGEWGSDDIPPGEQATYINQMQAFVAQHHSIVGALYWDTHVGNCDYKVDGNAGSISALAAMGRSAALQGHV
jgi:hypothetical protein